MGGCLLFFTGMGIATSQWPGCSIYEKKSAACRLPTAGRLKVGGFCLNEKILVH